MKALNAPAIKKVFVGLSGGVDSALSAALLLEQGYDVTGVFIETWHPEFLPCTWKDERRDAMRAAAHLKIPFTSLDLSDAYKKEVGDYFIEEYRKGRTPNPDVLCNRSIKFGGFADFARKNGADYIATGHYARVLQAGGRAVLGKGIDEKKDQSYFLWMLTDEDLRFTLFPVGHLTKDQVRAEAKKRGLPNATKKDSQGICFLGEVDLRQFLSQFMTLKEGSVVDSRGAVVGTHSGAEMYTQGERHGFSVTDPKLRSEALFVLSTDTTKNTIEVGPKEQIPLRNSVLLSSPVVHLPVLAAESLGVSRYRGEGVACKVIIEDGSTRVFFEKPTTASVGQSLVLYNGDLLVGGGIMESFE